VMCGRVTLHGSLMTLQYGGIPERVRSPPNDLPVISPVGAKLPEPGLFHRIPYDMG